MKNKVVFCFFLQPKVHVFYNSNLIDYIRFIFVNTQLSQFLLVLMFMRFVYFF